MLRNAGFHRSYRQRLFVEHYLGESSGSAVTAARRAEYQWPEKLGPRLVEKGRSLYTKGLRRRWLHRKRLRPFGYRLLNEAAGRHTVCFNT